MSIDRYRARQSDIAQTGPLPAGLYSLETKPSNSLNSVLVVCRQVGSSSHKYLWNQLDQLLHHLETIGGLDVRSRAVIAGLRSVIDSPIPLSAFRNRINYSLDSVAAISPWASQLSRITDEASLEGRLAGVAPQRTEQRIELVALATASLIRHLYGDYLNRADRPDQRPQRRRRNMVLGDGNEAISNLRHWI
jgi:hypothetical protein